MNMKMVFDYLFKKAYPNSMRLDNMGDLFMEDFEHPVIQTVLSNL